MGDDFNRALEQLRATHGVRLVQSHEEGTAAADLPEGVYGFTTSPGLAAPLFATRRYRNFEVHRLQGDVAIVGFVTPREAAGLMEDGGGQADADDVIDITLYPNAEGEASVLATVSYSSIVQHRQYSLRNAAGLPLRVRRRSSPVSSHASLARHAARPPGESGVAAV
jgi:hypothetical protein